MLTVTLEMARGLAALWVFFFHVGPMMHAASPLAGVAADCGNLGVPVFFVISGFVMYASAGASQRRRLPATTFMRRRLLRIYPPYWAAFVLALVSPFLLELLSTVKSGQYHPPVVRWADFTTVDWLQFVTLTRVFTSHDGDLQGAFNAVNAVYWTLAIEVQFYVVMFVALLTRAHWRRVLVGVSVLSLATLPVAGVRESGLFLPYWPTFACGLLLRHLMERRRAVVDTSPSPRTAWAAAVLLAGFAAIVLGGHADDVFSLGHRVDREFGVAVYVALLFWCLADVEAWVATDEGSRLVRPLRWIGRPFLWLGASSYSLYLIHGRTYGFAEAFARQLVPGASLLYPLLVIVPTCIAAYAFSVLFERPFMSPANVALSTGRAVPLTTGAVAPRLD